MTPPVWLIAEREFRAYAATLSFWIALAVGPLAMAGALGLAALAAGGAAPAVVVVQAPDAELARAARAAVNEVAGIEGRKVVVAERGPAGGARLVVTNRPGGLDARFDGAAVLSAEGQALVARTIERDAALGEIRRMNGGGFAPPPPSGAAGWSPSPASLGGAGEDHADPLLTRAAERNGGGGAARSDVTEGAQGHSTDVSKAGPASRFALVMMLWLTLTGSLGMLLQAVVRERANRALESLLAAARPWEIVFGKLLGVGAVSLLVLGAWLGSAAALSPLVPSAGGLAGAVLQGLAEPALLARAGLIYLLAFAFYGLVTVAVGAAARDTAAAQNLSRPMFTVLLAAFFAALAAASGAGGLAWLAYVPPFTPFMLLLQAPGEMGLPGQLAAVSLLAGAALMAGVWAVGSLGLTTSSLSIPWFSGRKAT